jgi:hypothetical protein
MHANPRLRHRHGFASRAGLAVVATLALAGCIPHPDGTPSSATDPVVIVLIGDSLTEQYAPVFTAVASHQGAGVLWSAFGGGNPVDSPWADWITHHRDYLAQVTGNAAAKVDYVVLQDQAVLGPHPGQVHHTAEEYVAAWQQAVDAAHAVLRPARSDGVGEGEVIALAGNHPDISTVRGIDRLLPVAPLDNGQHWTEAGAAAEAHLLCEQLSQGAACPR